MEELEKRLGNIYKGIEKILSLERELEGANNKLLTDNKELTKKIEVLEAQLRQKEENKKQTDYQQQANNTQKNQLINKKIDDLLSEVEQCMQLFKK